MDFLFCMQQRNLLDRGDYIIISVDEEIYNPQVEKEKGNLEAVFLNITPFFLAVRSSLLTIDRVHQVNPS